MGYGGYGRGEGLMSFVGFGCFWMFQQDSNSSIYHLDALKRRRSRKRRVRSSPARTSQKPDSWVRGSEPKTYSAKAIFEKVTMDEDGREILMKCWLIMLILDQDVGTLG